MDPCRDLRPHVVHITPGFSISTVATAEVRTGSADKQGNDPSEAESATNSETLTKPITVDGAASEVIDLGEYAKHVVRLLIVALERTNSPTINEPIALTPPPGTQYFK